MDEHRVVIFPSIINIISCDHIRNERKLIDFKKNERLNKKKIKSN